MDFQQYSYFLYYALLFINNTFKFNYYLNGEVPFRYVFQAQFSH